MAIEGMPWSRQRLQDLISYLRRAGHPDQAGASPRPRVTVRAAATVVSALEQELDRVAEEVLDLFAELRVLLEVGVGVEDLLGDARAPRSRSARRAGGDRA